MADRQIDCVNKTEKTHEAITNLGGPYNGRWKWPKAQVVKAIEDKTDTFYTFVNGRRADVFVQQGAKEKYVQTKADGIWSDNLLALSSCS